MTRGSGTAAAADTAPTTEPAVDAPANGATRTAFRTCPLCEAGCGLEITLRRGADGTEQVGRIRGDRDDVFSHGYICPKGSTLKQLHEDPDRLRRPLVKGADGVLAEASWEEAWAAVAEGLQGVIQRHGRDAVAAYVGNPNAHNLGALVFLKPLLKALGTTSLFSASTVDQRPKEVSAGLMFGGFTVPVPDIDRTDFLLMLGANPWASNGSLATAPDWPGRIEAIIERGGDVLVVDPRRSRTAEAGEWWPIRPGTDAHLLAALCQVIFEEDLVDLGTVADHVAGLDEVAAAIAPFTPEAVAGVTGIGADRIRELAHRLVAARTAAVYGRIGTTTQAFGTVVSWLVDILNVITGNLDRPGGAMFTKAAAGQSNTRGTPGTGRGVVIHRRHTRVRGLPETLGELPAAALAEEIDTPGDGQIRGLVTAAGNPVLSTPNAARLDAALDGLEFMVSVDIYVNETTRHADVILPVPSALQKSHYDLALLQLALRNVANYSPPVLPLDEGQPDEWEVFAKLALIAMGEGPDADPAVVDDFTFGAVAAHADEAVVAEVSERRGPERILDLMLRTGPYEVTLDDLIANPHGIDLGALEPRIPEALRTPSGKIELAPEPIVSDVERLRASLDPGNGGATDERPFLLVGRRHLRSNNSWMHNVNVLVKGKPRCTLQVHPDDADRLGLTDGDPARVASRVGAVTIAVEVTDGIVPGVVSIPHGWGHDLPGVQLRVAAEHAGVNSNVLADEELYDPISGNAVLNGIPVSVAPA
jgi:anaerobic selenocysteine-containing dehydrogenase